MLFFLGAGALAGTVGTLIGAGGGFLLVPLLLLTDPDALPQTVTALSLSAVAMNAWSGSVVYARRKRILYRPALVFALCSLPGVVFGVLATARVSRETFMPLFAALLGVLAVYSFIRGRGGADEHLQPTLGSREYLLGGIASACIAVLATFLGIGGGLLHVPFFVYVLRFAPHYATATSHAVLALTATLATVLHFARGDLAGEGLRVLGLGVGVIVGAQLGARLSTRLKGALIMRVLALALLLVAIRVGVFG